MSLQNTSFLLLFQHPKFQSISLPPNGSYAHYDYGLVQLMSPAVLSHTAKLICLPFGKQQFVGKKLTVSGWGITDPVTLTDSPSLMSVDITGFPSKDCAAIVPPVYVIDPQIHLCAGIHENRGPLDGDSGGNSYLDIFILQVEMDLI